MEESTQQGAGSNKSVFPALLRYWRQQRGMSQLDLAIASSVSARHLSFLETGRSQPSVEMVLLLAETLDVRLRNRNEILRSAGFDARYSEPSVEELLSGPVGETLGVMLKHHDPFPMIVLDRLHYVLAANEGARRFFTVGGLPGPVGLNLFEALFQPEIRGLLTNWDSVASDILRRVQRECLHRPGDEELGHLLAGVLQQQAIPKDWRTPDLTQNSDPMARLEATIGEVDLSFLVTLTTFNAPNNVTLDEIIIESYIPNNATTRAFFA